MKSKNTDSYCIMENGRGTRELLTISGSPAVLLPRNSSLSPRHLKPKNNLCNSRSSSTTPITKSCRTPIPRSITSNSESRKLVLHFDVRNTVLVADSVTQIGVEQALNSYLTGVTWGKVDRNGEWKWVSDTPSLNAPAPDCVTYYKHLEKILVRTPTDRGHLRRQTGDFTQVKLGEEFLPYFERTLDHFEWRHPESDEILTMKGKNGKLYHYILPSLFQLIQHLHDTQRDFAFVIRTYGMDAPNVLKAISHSLLGKHVDFPHLPQNIKVNLNPGHIKRFQDGGMCAEIDVDGVTHKFNDEKDIYKFITSQKGVCAFVDDFTYWQDNSYDSSCAKPFWINPKDSSVQHIIFDDNIRLTDSDSIVDLRMFSQNENQSGKFSSVKLSNTKKFENMCLVHADLLQSTENINYFIDKVELCEKNYSKFLNNFS